MLKYLGGLAFLMAGFASVANAQYRTVITPPPGGVPIISGGMYTAGTQFANGMAYPPGTIVTEAGSVTQAAYAAPVYMDGSYYGMYPQGTYYNPGYASFGLSFGTGAYGYYPGYSGYGGYTCFGNGYGRGYYGHRAYGGRRR